MVGLRTVALCIGGSRDVWKELEQAKALVGNRASVVIATNYAGRFYRGDIDAWATLHPESFEAWRDERADRGLNTDYRALMYYGRKKVAGTEAWRQRWNGSSGLFAAQLAFDAMDCAGAILCGVPLDQESGHFHDPGKWSVPEHYRDGFRRALADGAPIRSMSGWTADLLGRPTEDWLDSLNLTPTAHRRPPEPEIRMKEVTFAKRYRHRMPDGHADYSAGSTHTVSEEVATKAAKAGALKVDPLDHDLNGRKGGAKPKAD